MAQIHGKEQSIKAIFSEDYAFSIPPYQRPYSWGREQVCELYDDLLASSRQSKASDREPYFLGSIVLIKAEGIPDAEVIDGQQRLTSLSLLLAVLMEKLPANLTDGMKNLLYEKGNAIMGTKDRFRLQIRDRDNDFYEANVLKAESFKGLREMEPKPLPDPQKRLRDNLLYFEDQLALLSQGEIEAFASYLIQNTFLIVVWTPNLESAFRIFSVLNDRGLDLSAADILKAEIIGTIPEGQRDAYTEKWEEAEELLGTDAFADLFTYIRFLHARKKQRGSILNEFREYVKAKDTPKEFIDSQLVPYAEASAQIIHQSYESSSGADEVNRYLRFLSRMDDQDWVAPAILYHAKNKNNAAKLAKFYTDLERLASVLWILRFDINKRIERYGALIGAISNDKNLSAEDSPLQLTMEEMTAAVETLDGDIYNISRKSKRTMILLRLDELLSSGEAAYDFPVISIEHVLPQNPAEESQWLTWWPEEERRNIDVHRLGNLVLLNRRQNSSANNFELEQKKSSYFTTQSGMSPFALTTQVLGEDEWTPAVFEKRQRELVGRLKEAWRL